MATLSSSRTRRSRSRVAAATRQILTFKLQDEWFALPLEAVQKVTVLGEVYGDSNHSGISLTMFEGRELAVVDVAQRIFNRSEAAASEAPSGQATVTFLVVVRSTVDAWIGLPTFTPPSVRRVPETAFANVPETYRTAGNIQCVSSLAVQTDEEPPIFMLDRDRLVASPVTL